MKPFEYKELIEANFIEREQYGDCVVTSCKPINDDTIVQIEAKRPYLNQNGNAFASGSYKDIKKVAELWRNVGYYDFHIWAD